MVSGIPKVDLITGLTRELDDGGSGQFSINEILSTESFTIEERRQMIVNGEIIIDGELVVDGELNIINI